MQISLMIITEEREDKTTNIDVTNEATNIHVGRRGYPPVTITDMDGECLQSSVYCWCPQVTRQVTCTLTCYFFIPVFRDNIQCYLILFILSCYLYS